MWADSSTHQLEVDVNRNQKILGMAIVMLLAVAAVWQVLGDPAQAARRSNGTTPTNIVGTSVVGPPATGVPGAGSTAQPGTDAQGQPGTGTNVYSTAVTTTVTGPSQIPPTPVPTTKPLIRITWG
jgi:hypothetical protein